MPLLFDVWIVISHTLKCRSLQLLFFLLQAHIFPDLSSAGICNCCGHYIPVSSLLQANASPVLSTAVICMHCPLYCSIHITRPLLCTIHILCPFYQKPTVASVMWVWLCCPAVNQDPELGIHKGLKKPRIKGKVKTLYLKGRETGQTDAPWESRAPRYPFVFVLYFLLSKW